MSDIASILPLPGFWSCRHGWRTSAKNTFWCLFGYSPGDFGTIAFSKLAGSPGRRR